MFQKSDLRNCADFVRIILRHKYLPCSSPLNFLPLRPLSVVSC